MFQVSYFFIFGFTYYCSSKVEQHRFLQKGVLILSIAVAVVGMIQALSPTVFGLMDIDSDRPVFSTFGNATYFAGFIVVLLPLILSWTLTTEKYSLKQYLLITLLLVLSYLLIMTETRSSWVALIVSIVLFAFLQFKSAKSRWLMIGVLVMAAVLVVFLFPEIIRRRLDEVLKFTVPGSITRRLLFYEAAWKGFLFSPMLGYGMGNTVVSLPFFRSPDYWMTQAEDIVTHLHNEYLEVLSETGIVGFLPWATMLVVYFIGMKRAIQRSQKAERTLLVGYVCAVVACLVDNLTSMNLRVPPVAVLYWCIVGISARQAGEPSRAISLRLPHGIRSFQWMPVAFLVVFIYYYIPHVRSVYGGDENFYEGLYLHKQGKNTSQQYFRRAVQIDPDHEDARFYLSLNLVQGKSFQEARNHLDTLISQFPAYPKARLLLALSLLDLGDTARAFEEAEKDLKLATYPQSLHYMCVIAFRAQRPEVEYRYTILRLQKSIESKTIEYVEEAVGRLGHLCKERETRDSCRTIILQSTQTFGDKPSVLLAASNALINLRYTSDAKKVLELAAPGVGKDSIHVRRYDALLSKLQSISE
jgi:O-antigen ligase